MQRSQHRPPSVQHPALACDFALLPWNMLPDLDFSLTLVAVDLVDGARHCELSVLLTPVAVPTRDPSLVACAVSTCSRGCVWVRQKWPEDV
eukprot:360919-Chlamydomonas_euryale.AAC.7